MKVGYVRLPGSGCFERKLESSFFVLFMSLQIIEISDIFCLRETYPIRKLSLPEWQEILLAMQESKLWRDNIICVSCSGKISES